MNRAALIKIAQDLVTDQKGILAADESTGTIKKRFDGIGVDSTPENHRRYRELLFTTESIEKYIGGIILFDETIRQSTASGKPFLQLIAEKGIMPGIKVDQGKKELANFPGEEVTEGIDGLRGRLTEYQEMGARFTKWRAVYKVSNSTPSRTLIESNADLMARYAALVQEAGMVPIVEPETLMDGNHSLDKCEEVTRKVLEAVFNALFDHNVILEATILKTNMIVAGKESGHKMSPLEIAQETVRVMKEVVSVAVPSVVFLSGGLGPQESTLFLDAINKLGPHPWELNFSFGRALQGPVLDAWQGKDENIEKAQKAFLKRARLNSLALKGKYNPEMENEE